MKKDTSIFLKHILDSANDIENYIRKLKRENFLRDKKTQDAVIKRIEVIGEATKNLPPSFKNKHRDIPWEKIAAARNILIHEYFGVDLKLVWRIAKKEMPKLKKQISGLLKKLSKPK